MQADIADRAALARMMQGVRALVHLAGVGGPYDLEALFRVNARGLFDAFEAARLAGVERIVFASSNHAFGCYPITEPVTPEHKPRPDSLYGVFKVLGETMLQYYHDRHGISSVSLRIGTYRPLPIDQRSLATWLSPADVTQLVDLSLRHPDPGALVVNGYSANTRIRTRDPNWAVLGYRPGTMPRTHVAMLRGMGVDVDGGVGVAGAWRRHRARSRAPAGTGTGQFGSALDEAEQVVLARGFSSTRADTETGGAVQHVRRQRSRDEQRRRGLATAAQGGQHLEPAHLRHVLVDDEAARPARGGIRQVLAGGGIGLDGMARGFQQEPQRVPHRRVVVHDRYDPPPVGRITKSPFSNARRRTRKNTSCHDPTTIWNRHP